MSKILDSSEWGEFKLGDVFKLVNCKCSNATNLIEGKDLYYIGAKKNDNGVMKKVAYESELITKGNCIIFICDGQGSIGFSNYMNIDFIGSTTLTAGYNKNLNKYIGMFLVTILDLERPRYSYGRKYRNSLSETIIKLPITREKLPDWSFMENYIKALYKPIEKNISTKTIKSKLKIEKELWKDFFISELFEIETGKDLIYSGLEEGQYNVVGHGLENNGVVATSVELEDYKLYNHEEALSMAHIGNFFCTVQTRDFYLGTRTKALLPKFEDFNKLIGMFISTVINKEKYRFAYGRVGSDKIPNLIIRLPVDNMGKLNIKYMEEYIKSLPYSDLI